MEKENEKKVMISIDHLYKAYGKKEVLLGLNLEIYEGELFGFIGRNGIGKSTTIDCMIGAKKIDKGTIVLDGYDMQKDPIEAKKTFGYVASEPTCYEVMTGYDFLEFIDLITTRSIYNFNVPVNADDKIITLSTCSNNGTKRLVIHAVLIDE